MNKLRFLSVAAKIFASLSGKADEMKETQTAAGRSGS